MNNAHCCCGNTQPPDPCPAPCVVVELDGIQANYGGVEHPCYVTGGVVARSSGGVSGIFLIPAIGSVYSASFPISISAIQSEGEGEYTRWIGGTMTITVSVGTCTNGVLDGYTSVSVSASLFAISPEDVIDPGPYSTTIFTSSETSLKPMGAASDNALTIDGGGCVTVDVLNFHHSGVATVYQPKACTLDPVYYFAERCDDPSDRILVDLSTQPSGGAATCEYGGERYRLTNDWTQSGSPVSVSWSYEICPVVVSNPIGRQCDDSSSVVAFDPDLRPVDGETFIFGGDRYLPTGEVMDMAASSVTWSTEPCPQLGKIGRRCDGQPGEVTYDPASQPDGALTFFYAGLRYYPTNIDSVETPVMVTWNSRGCNTGGPGPINPCVDNACQPFSPNFPACCELVFYASCIQCIGVFVMAGPMTTGTLVSAAGTTAGRKIKNTTPARRGKFGSDAELDAMGHSPEGERTKLKRGGCCDPPLG